MSDAVPEQTGQLEPLSADNFEMLLEASRTLASELRLPALLEKVMELSARLVRAETGSLLLLEETTGELYFHVAMGDSGERLKEVRLKLGEGIAGWVAENRKPLIVNDVRRDPRWSSRGDEKSAYVTRQLVAVPLLHQGRCLGVVEGLNKKGGGGFTPTDRRALEIFASQVAVAVENARLFERIEDEKETLSTLFREMSDGAVMTDADGRVIFLNPAGATLLGSNLLDALGQTVTDLWAGFDVRPSWSDLAASEGPQAFEGARRVGKALLLGGFQQRLQSGKGRLWVFRDVTDARRDERMKRNFLSMVSHKFRTPLAVITGYAPLLLQDESLTRLQRQGLSAIESQGQRLVSLVDKLLRFTALEAQELSLTRQPLVPRLELGAVLEELKETFAEKGVHVFVEGSLEGLPSVLADAERFRDVFRHLLDNAVKFNPQPRKEIRLSGGEENDGVRVGVEDNGPGIPSEELPHLFQKFHQIEDHFTGQVEGAGLGLALAKRLVEAHGGRLTAGKSSLGGAAFWTVWPKA